MGMDIAKRIVAIRREKGLTQTEFAERLNTTRPKIAAYELDRVNFDGAFLDYICKVFNISPEWLTTGQGDMYVQTKQSFVERLADEYGLSFTAQKIVECYLNLDDEQRATVDGFITSVAESLVEVPAEKEVVTAPPLSIVDNVIERVDMRRAASSEDNHGGESVSIPIIDGTAGGVEQEDDL
ncbi:hypothetical protein FACS18949_12780 [Clostridia bacterium]|nr:hypothetical protein FACS18949_12780 [Clostridia bacterium]